MPIPWNHLEIAGYVGLALLLIYKPPAMRVVFDGLGKFIERHFGDSIGLYLLHLGIGLIILGDVFHQMEQVGHVGESLILAAMGVLKLKSIPAPNGTNGAPSVDGKSSLGDQPGSAAPPANVGAEAGPAGAADKK
jgi:hypothetical protein